VNDRSKTADWYADHVLADVELFAGVLERGPLDAAVAACPGWDVARLAVHLGTIHRWARHNVIHASPPEDTSAFKPERGLDGAGLAAWLRAGAAELVDTLRTLDPEAPTWHPFLVAKVAGVWPRRQAHETVIHRWDAERAVGSPSPIDAELASDGIDEYFELGVSRKVTREQLEYPTGSLHVHCTDVEGEWFVWADDEGYHVERIHQKGDAALRGPAEALLLRLWGRTSEGADELSPIGDESVLESWLSIAGL